MVYALFFGLTGLYFSAAFSRLLVYSSIALGILGGIGFAELVFALVKPSTTPLVKKKPTYRRKERDEGRLLRRDNRPGRLPAGTYWIPNPIPCTYTSQLFCDHSPADTAVSIVNGAPPSQRSAFSDWISTLQWVRQDTPTNAVIISWWDYGYWITVMGNRTRCRQRDHERHQNRSDRSDVHVERHAGREAMAESMGEGRPTYVAIFVTGSIFPLKTRPQEAPTITTYYRCPAGTDSPPAVGTRARSSGSSA